MADVEKAETPLRLTRIQWLICVIAAIGFAFDTYELLMLPLVIRPAIENLGNVKFGTPEFSQWRDLFFYVPAVCGGVFGLLGGYLTDRFGRRRVLVWSILVYAFSAFAAGFANSLTMLLILRCTTFIGVCVEFVAAVAWLAELFPDPKQREKVLGYTQAFSSFGGLMVSGVAYLIADYATRLPAIYGEHRDWRYLLISGVVPAIPLIIIRPFLPESPMWKKKKTEGTLKRPSIAQLFRPEFKRTTLITTLMVAASFAVAFGAIQHTPQMVPELPGVKELPPLEQRQVASSVQLIQEIGGLAGRFFLAFLAVRIVSRRKLIRIFQAPGLVIVPLVFIFAATSDLTLLKIGIFVAGFLTVAQFSFWGNYLPRVFPTHLRGTGESFSANVGGRMFGTSAALLTTQLAATMPGASAATHLAYAAAAVAFLAFGIGLVSSFWLPEPKQEELPE
jgi:predicted MFS family arabinose efflux permease